MSLNGITRGEKVVLSNDDGVPIAVTNTTPATDDYGVVVRPILEDPLPVDVQATVGLTDTELRAATVPTTLTDNVGAAIGTRLIHGQLAILATDRPHSDDVFFGFGEQDISGAVDNADIWGGVAATQPEPTPAGYALYIKSDSASDTAAGIGAQTTMVHYLDTAGVLQTVTATLNGLTEVNTGVTDCMFVQDAHHMTVGTNLVGVGNVDCLAGTGGAIVQRIGASGNQSMSTMRQVPAGFNLVVTGWRAYSTAATTKIANIRLRSTGHDGVNNPGVYHFKDSVRLKDGNTGDLDIQFSVPPLGTIKISAWTTGTMGLTARWHGYLETVV